MKQPKIIHILANGQRVDSIEGHVVPADNPVYEILFRSQIKTGEKEK